mmetsp:Transcript_14920/g.7263  ORF Transcript_14920/g.7263 Transcript_14920/m.7263 type:complete len:158 (+) Transcript_14920:276-749(+)
MEACRYNLINTLAEYKKIKHYKITIVFDGTKSPDFLQRKDINKGINIRFSRCGETADEVIKRMAVKEREKAVIVTSDSEILNFVRVKGCATISSPEFENKLSMAAYMDAKGFNKEEERSGWVPTIKKKGPSRRLSKKERRNRVKIKKLGNGSKVLIL